MTMHGHIGLLLLRSCWKVKISLEWIGQHTPKFKSHVWDASGRRIAARLHHPENTQQLKQMLIKEWALLPQEMLHQLVLSMRRRCEATIAIVTSVQEDFDLVDDETDEDEEHINNESSKGPSNADTFSALEKAIQ
ncbi:transposable element Tcb2 transposase [Trichonephila clavipes]|nr:transposable element Tcb2 transposase [Trichonephila clavipes]